MVDPFDLGSLFGIRAILETLDPDGSPAMSVLGPHDPGGVVALLPGSFDPPTAAHVLMAERARAEGAAQVVFTLARRIAGKSASGLIPEDRVLALRACANGFPIGLTSHGLYADQAEAARGCFPEATLVFLVGSDKVFQILDDRWYDDRDAALERLFACATLVVAPRADDSERLRAVLADPRNRPWVPSIEVLRLHPAVSDLSSTRVRGLLRAGADPTGLVPPGVAGLVGAVHAFEPPRSLGAEDVDAYAIRAGLIDALWRFGFEPAAVDLHALQRAAEAADEHGKALRDALRDGTLTPADLAAAGAHGAVAR